MSDRKDAPGTGGEPNSDPQSSHVRIEDGDRQEAGWLDRLKAAVGLKPATFREELEEALAGDAPDAEDSFTPEERALLRNIVSLRELRVEDVMVPRADIDAVEVGITIGELILKFRETGHSRIPVYRETLDDPLGMVLLKDLLAYITRPRLVADQSDGAASTAWMFEPVDLRKPLSEADLIRRVLFVPSSMAVMTLLGTMQSERMQMALVIDEYGGTDGLVSIEDAVETVVGEIEDEHDEEGPMIIVSGDGAYEVDGRASLEEVAEEIDEVLAAGPEGEEIETIGGLVFSLLGRIPAAGERIVGPGGYELEVLDADPRRIKRLKVRPPAPDQDLAGPAQLPSVPPAA